MIAGTWFDLVLGLDLHVVAIPAPPSPVPVPTPVPMPFVGLVFDPLGFAVGSAVGMALGGGPGLVLINGLPATNCGTAVTNLLTLPHTPAPGVAFVPPPAPHNDAELFFGADHVSLGGSLAVRLGDVALSCSDPVRLPTSTVLALPKGAPVLITPPRVPDLAAMAVAGAARGLGAAVRRGGKLFRNVRRVQRRSATWERISGALRNAVDRIAPRRFRDRLKRAVCFVTGHPVDVANGRVFTSQVDFELPGPLPLVFERVYSSSLSWRDGPLGYGWSHSLDQAVWTEPGKVVYLADDGREIEFLLDGLPDGILPPGDVVYEPTNRLTLKALDALRWEIEAHDGLTHEFAPIQGAAAPTRAKLVTIRSRDKHRIELHPRFGDFSPASLRMGGPPVRAPWRATFERDLLGNETARLLPGAIVSRWRHDEMSRPSEHRIARGNIDVSSVAYQFEAEDEITTLVEHGKGATRFTHDERAFLVGATGPDGSIQHRAVDATGNIFKSPDRHDRRYGAGGRLEEADGTRHVHDADGQLIEKRLPDGRRWLYAWNVRGELLSVTRPDGQRVQFMYDALGRRTRKELGALGTAYVWDGDDLIHEVVDGAPLVTWEFAPGTFAPLAKVEGEQRYSVVTDHLGTPETLFDAHGEIAWKARLDLYGVATEQTAITACPWRWPGQYEDPETGLYYNRFRYYDPAAGRYISQDPIQLNGGLHLYAYVSCPTDESDPYGLACYKAKLSPNGLEIGKQISEKDAINRLRNGLDVFSDTKTMARSLAKRAIQGKPMHHPPHHPGYYPHFHPAQHATRSHSFYDRQR